MDGVDTLLKKKNHHTQDFLPKYTPHIFLILFLKTLYTQYTDIVRDVPFDPPSLSFSSLLIPPQSMSDSSEAIRVVARLKPLETEISTANGTVDPICRLLADGKTVEVRDDLDHRTQFPFDAVLGARCEQDDVFHDVAAPVLAKLLAGYNAGILAYGQTASGKTHTMFGTTNSPGLAPRVLHNLIDLSEASPNIAVLASAVQIYNEGVYDLLAPLTTKGESPKREMWWVNGRYEVRAPTTRRMGGGDVVPLLSQVDSRRALGETRMNVASSRSHVVIVVDVIQSLPERGTDLISTLYLVDLAGCEALARTQATGQRATEAININKSLSTLKRVIETLCENAKRRTPLVVPYRESVLTRLLQDCMGGSAATTLVCTVSQHPLNLSETARTLAFGQTSRAIVNTVVQHYRPSFKQLEKLVADATRVRSAMEVEVLALLQRLPADQRASFAEHLKAAGVNPQDAPATQSLPDVIGPHGTPAEMCCPISGLYFAPDDTAFSTRPMKDPCVSLDGRSYERSALENYWGQHRALPPSGGAQTPSAQRLVMFPNKVLQERIAAREEAQRWPCDVLMQVFAYLVYDEVSLVRGISRLWRRAGSGRHLWEALARRDYPREVRRYQRRRNLDWREAYSMIVLDVHGPPEARNPVLSGTDSDENKKNEEKKTKKKKKKKKLLDGYQITKTVEFV